MIIMQIIKGTLYIFFYIYKYIFYLEILLYIYITLYYAHYINIELV